MQNNFELKSKLLVLLVLIVFIVTRVPDLGQDNFNTDVWKWKKRIFDFSTGVFNLKFEQTVQTYHPGVTLMWLGSVAVKFNNLYKDFYNNGLDYPEVQEIFNLDFAQKIFVVLGISFGLLGILLGIHKLLGNKGVILFGLVLIFEPFYVALTRVIHLEGLTTTYLFASVMWLYVWFKNKSKKSLYTSGFFGALAVLTKTSALFILPFSFVFVLLISKKVSDYGRWFGVFTITSLIIWPALLFKPLYVANYLYQGVTQVGIEEGHDQFYFGQYVSDPGLSFYPVVLGYKTSIFLLLTFALSILFLSKYSHDRKHLYLYFITFTLLYLLQITLPSKKLDRYVLPVIFGLVGCTTIFLEYIFHTYRQKTLMIFGVIASFVLTTLYTFSVHPDYFSYYSPLFGGIRQGIFVLEPKWLIGKDEIIDYLSKLKVSENLSDFAPNENIENLLYDQRLNSKLTVGFQEKFYTQIHPFVRKIGGWATIEDLGGQAVKTKFFIYPVWDDISSTETRFKLVKIGEVNIRGVPVYMVIVEFNRVN